MQWAFQATRVALSTSTGRGGWCKTSFLHWKAGKMTMIEAKVGNLKKPQCMMPAPRHENTVELEELKSNPATC